MPSLKRHLGELVIDHRASPGTRHVPEGQLFETATFTCSHCQKQVVEMDPQRVGQREWCRSCDRYICDRCAKAGICRPYDKLADTLLRQAASGLFLPR